MLFRSSHWRCFVKKGVLKSPASFTGKHLRWTLFNKVTDLQACNFVKKRLEHRCFPVKFATFLRTPILKIICEVLLLVITVYVALNSDVLN